MLAVINNCMDASSNPRHGCSVKYIINKNHTIQRVAFISIERAYMRYRCSTRSYTPLSNYNILSLHAIDNYKINWNTCIPMMVPVPAIRTGTISIIIRSRDRQSILWWPAFNHHIQRRHSKNLNYYGAHMLIIRFVRVVLLVVLFDPMHGIPGS